jgi:hypothetical protein
MVAISREMKELRTFSETEPGKPGDRRDDFYSPALTTVRLSISAIHCKVFNNLII